MIPGAVGRREPTAGNVMIAYLFWHCAYPTTTAEQYEEALMRFQQRLGQQHRRASAAVPHFVLRPCAGSAIGPDTRIGAC